MLTPAGSRLFQTASGYLEGQFRLWTIDSTNITKLHTSPRADDETQYTLKIQKHKPHEIEYVYVYI